MPISERLSQLGSGVFARNDSRKADYVARLNREASTAGASLPPLLDLSLGSTDLPPPPAAISAIAAALQRSDSAAYCLHAATLPFREAAAAWAERRFGVAVDPEREVLLLVGSQEGTAHLPLAVLNPGDQALLLDPYYPSHRGGLHLASARPVFLPLDPARNWRPDPEQLSSSQWQALKLMVLGFPHNPTATTGAQDWLDPFVDRALRHDIVLAHDNPYVDLALEGEAPALLRHPGWRRCGIEFFSLSKSWCLGGYRLAFAIGAEWLITALRQLKGVVDFNQSLALQAGAIAALEQEPHWPERLRTVYRERRDRMATALEAAGWPVRRPSMALYLWLALPPAARPRGWDSETFGAALLEATGVALTPGNGFGAAGEGWLRLALVHPSEELEAGAARIGAWLRQL
ncbi:aminotransferase class I/II-fold pyridoxal phosphate-dependent enzyme [Synechococcus sp. CCY9201]|jgi:aspartate/methionine/tyrosine aminotransferase|uniref:aminotransferase class I/II-fold pyridoxal phosphate-dependent enzyme n=1 Tax=unclassified Synechococcus TaxID=2626047 RepID=UPI0018CEDBFD|nr:MULTISPECIES: aminotransferase class I/II-fold pyridoxal phosphate-dependent enzyme [unclassified Synechococcus]MEA5422222.1 aminotransferase class I/II-fold pyridoxal phosphate-dependent enzyme [Synechococcus sp. CCY9202]MEA5475166.1 aminotransferase class I/II-fold pyridoxal phosphate-dependent enzyme [Synechococcus sp. CCY9201]QPN58597.1 aminotransferase class I/II-fold pyridoxal phosphate-dependent enzyme [Synechococcus sp. CBW1002]QPN65337.1 aminotransferase class I/II-fold pyridoxal ph